MTTMPKPHISEEWQRSMKDLIGRLEKATGPDPQLDRLIEESMPDVRPHFDARMVADGYVLEANGVQAYLPPHYTSSIDAALLGEDIISVSEQKQRPGQPIVWVAVHRPPKKGSPPEAGRGHTEPLARRVAALKARATIVVTYRGSFT